jgi:hypothetical protein
VRSDVEAIAEPGHDGPLAASPGDDGPDEAGGQG